MKTIILESNKQYLHLNKILESVNISLLEMLTLAEPIKKAIEDSDLDVPKFFKNIDNVDLINTWDLNHLMVRLDSDKEMKIGRFFTKLFPELKPDEINRIVARVKLNLRENDKNTDYEFIIYRNNIGDWYKKCLSKSCATKEDTSHLPYIYDEMNQGKKHHVSILILYKNNIPFGRALVWYDIEGANDGIFMDRVYPSEDEFYEIHEMFYDYARRRNWTYRKNSRRFGYLNIYNGEDTLELDLSDVWSNISIMPYMDTFRYGTKNGILYNIEPIDSYTRNYTNIYGTSIPKTEFEYSISNYIISNKSIPYSLFNEHFNLDSDIIYKGNNIVRLYLTQYNINDLTNTDKKYPDLIYFLQQYFYIDDNNFDKLLFDKNINISILQHVTKEYMKYFKDTIIDVIQKSRKNYPSYNVAHISNIVIPILGKYLKKFINFTQDEFIQSINGMNDLKFNIGKLDNKLFIDIHISELIDINTIDRTHYFEINLNTFDNFIVNRLKLYFKTFDINTLEYFNNYIKDNPEIQKEIDSICNKVTNRFKKHI